MGEACGEEVEVMRVASDSRRHPILIPPSRPRPSFTAPCLLFTNFPNLGITFFLKTSTSAAAKHSAAPICLFTSCSFVRISISGVKKEDVNRGFVMCDVTAVTASTQANLTAESWSRRRLVTVESILGR